MATSTAARYSQTAIPHPDLIHRFRTSCARPLMGDILRDELGNRRYQVEEMAAASKRISEIINKRLAKVPGLEGFKFITNVSIFQNDGQGARMFTSMVWDPDSDTAVQEIYTNENIKCVALVLAICVY
ncbi:Tctex1 domain-containing protein 2 [Coemansia sp. RSA 2599]|nr:Tctex1 domain-containing protein 2 [Coemansia sp. RSA 2599]